MPIAEGQHSSRSYLHAKSHFPLPVDDSLLLRNLKRQTPEPRLPIFLTEGAKMRRGWEIKP